VAHRKKTHEVTTTPDGQHPRGAPDGGKREGNESGPDPWLAHRYAKEKIEGHQKNGDRRETEGLFKKGNPELHESCQKGSGFFDYTH